MDHKKGNSYKVPPASNDSCSKNQEAIREFQHVLKKYPPEEQRRIIQSVTSYSYELHSGPLPAPEALERYNQIIPDGANRIMRMAENQSNHRIRIEQEVITGQVKQSGRGQVFGLILAFISLGSAVVLGMYNHETVACIIGGATVVSLTSVFVIGKREQKAKLSEKRQGLETQSQNKAR